MPTRKFILLIPLLGAMLVLLAGQVRAGFMDDFKDPKDGAFDVSGMLDSPAGFLPIPIIITEPAVGYGGGLAVLYFHGSGEHGTDTTEMNWDTPSQFTVPNISARMKGLRVGIDVARGPEKWTFYIQTGSAWGR